MIDEFLEDDIWNCRVIFRAIRNAGYTGKETMLRRYVKPKRHKARPGVVRYETPIGKQLQHDWGVRSVIIGGELVTANLAVNVLGYGRAVHTVAFPSQDAEHTYEALIRSFEYFGGVCEQVLVDNQKAAVIDWRDGEPRFNTRFRELGRHYGFVPKACRPRRAQTKGKVERMVRYVKENALAGTPRFDDWNALNLYLEQWCNDEANQRFNRELNESVASRWARERPQLAPLPKLRFDTAYRAHRQVSLDAFISWKGCRYSVPGHLVNENVQLRVQLDGLIQIQHRGETVAEHRVHTGGNTLIVEPSHHASLWAEVQVSERSLDDYELNDHSEASTSNVEAAA